MKRTTIGLGGVLALVLAACGGGEAVTAEGAWARTSPMMASAGAVYMDLTSDEADRLIGASVDSSIAATTEVHETVEVSEHMGDGDMEEGEMESGDMEEGMSDDGDMSDMEGMGAMAPTSSVKKTVHRAKKKNKRKQQKKARRKSRK